MYGGGVEPGRPDSITPVRGTTVRGHLRFWWRATRGSRFQSVAELRARENDIWGSTKTGSPVGVSVKVTKKGTLQPCATYSHGSKEPRFRDGLPRYALFPFKGKYNGDPPPANDVTGLEFDLTITYPEGLQKDVEAALWGWVNFGGIGARTRRGCGALYCAEYAPESANALDTWIANAQKSFEFRVTGESAGWPVIGKTLLVNDNAERDGWESAVGLLQEFRQGKDVGRDEGSDRLNPRKLGRTRWPEPESVRDLVMRQREMDDAPAFHPEDARIPSGFFPRAEFGLPIIIEIRDEHVGGGINLKPTLQYSASQDRLASPLILRPMRFAGNQSGIFVLALSTPPLTSAYLAPGKADLVEGVTIPEDKICSKELLTYESSPLGLAFDYRPPNDAKGSAVESFVAFAKRRGYREVKI
jgi:CRISPR-associated protein Cmr1